MSPKLIRLCHLQKAVNSDFGPHASPLIYFLWSDGSEVRSIGTGFKFHCVILFLVSREPGTYRLRTSFHTIGWLPILDRTKLKVSVEDWKSKEYGLALN